jgi:tetratricopeptide (TPR) repeat protein
MKAMKRFVVFAIFLGFQTVFLTAQDSGNSDSLKTELEIAEGIERIDILNQLSELYTNSDPFQSYSYAREALRLASLERYPEGQIMAHENIGVFFRFTSQYSKALENCFKINELFEEIDGDSSLLIRNNNILGEVYRDLKEFDKALEYYEVALELSKRTGDFNFHIVINANIALAYIELGEFDKVLDISKETLELAEKRNYLFGIMISLYNIGLVNQHLEKHDIAIDYLLKLEDMVEQYSDQMGAEFTLGKIRLYYSIAESYYALGDLPLSEQYALKSWRTAEGSDFKIDFKAINDFLYTYYLHLGNHQEALTYFELSYKINDELKSEINNRQVLLLESLEEERKETIAMKLEQQKRDRRFRLEYFGISVVILVVFLLANIFGRYRISKQFSKAIIFLSFLLLFEFVLLLIDPPIEIHTSGEPVYKMIANSCLAIIFTFLHRFFEKRVTLS